MGTMTFKMKYFLLMVAMIFMSSMALADDIYIDNVPSGQTYLLPVDGQKPGELLLPNLIGTYLNPNSMKCSKPGCVISKVLLSTPVDNISGVSFSDDGNKYDVYRIPNVQGVGYAMGIKLIVDGVANPNYTPVNGANRIELPNPKPGTTPPEVGYDIKVWFVRTNEIFNDNKLPINIPQLKVALLRGYVQNTPSGSDLLDQYIFLGPFTLNMQAGTCTSVPASATINIGRIDSSDIPHVGDVSSTSGQTSIQLNCSFGVTLEAVVSDGNNPGNLGTDLTIAKGDGNATGVAVRLYQHSDDEMPIQLGPASVIKGATNQFFLKKAAPPFPSLSFDLFAKMVRISPVVVAGKVQATAIVSLSYQ